MTFTIGELGNISFRYNGDKLEVVRKSDNVVLMAWNTADGKTETVQTLETRDFTIGGRFFIPTGEILASAEELNDAGRFSRNQRVAQGNLASGNANAFSFAWENPETVPIIVTRVIINVTTAGGTALSVINVGSAADATTTSDNLIDGADLNAVAVYDNIDDQGANGESKQIVDVGEFVTGQILTENAAALEGTFTIYYTT
jgi:hypothetical protein